MEIISPVRSTVGAAFVYRGSLISALLFGVALLARTVIFVSDVHVKHSACVVGWPFLGDMFVRSLIGTVVGVPLSAKAMSIAERNNTGLLYARAALYFNCLLMPIAFFLVVIFPHFLGFVFPHYFGAITDFD